MGGARTFSYSNCDGEEPTFTPHAAVVTREKVVVTGNKATGTYFRYSGYPGG